MQLIRFAFVLAITILVTAGAPADEPQKPGPQPLLQSLPKDGAWVTYYALIKFSDGETQSEWTASSVGTKQVNGEPHRWLELIAKSSQGKLIIVYKALIPESEFGPGKNPIRHASEIWVKHLNAEPRKISSLKDEDPYFDLLLSGPVANVKKLDETESVDWQQGSLTCDIWEGENKLDTGFFKIENSQRLLKNDKVPFGIAASKVRLRGGDRTAEIEYVLTNFGTDAKTLLPDIK